MVTICQRAAEELENVFASRHTHVTTPVVPALRLHQEELLTEPVDTTEIDAPTVPDIDKVQDKAVVDASLSVETSTETPEVSNSSPLFVYSPPSKTSPSMPSPVSTPVSTSVLSSVSPPVPSSVSPSVSSHFEPSRLKLSGLPSPSKLFPFPPTPISQASFLAHDTYLQRPQPEPPPLPPELRCRRLAFYPLHRLNISPRVLR